MSKKTGRIDLSNRALVMAAAKRGNPSTLIAMPESESQSRAQVLMRRINQKFDVHTADDAAVITIYDEIGYFGITAQAVRMQLDRITQPKIKVQLNSPGGDAFDGIAIYNDLIRHPAEVEVEITGLAASAASVIAMAGDTVTIAETAFMMIHNAWVLMLGDKHELRDMADVLDQVDQSIAQTYHRQTAIDKDEIAALMDAETWLSGPDAVEQGFADGLIGSPEDDDTSANALFDLSAFKNVPAQMKRRVETGLRDVGFSKTEARTAIATGFKNLPNDGRWDADNAPRRDAATGDLTPLHDLVERLQQSL